MKALSIQQPWAWLIVNGYKPLENRTWPTNYRGRFLVHAGKTFDRDGYGWILRAGLMPVDFPSIGSFQMGGIVGAATLTTCLSPIRGNPPANLNPWRDPDQYAFVLADPMRLPFRAVRGMLGFFNIGDQRR